MDMNLQSNTTYKYAVTAVDEAGNESTKSSILTVTTKEQGRPLSNGIQIRRTLKVIK